MKMVSAFPEIGNSVRVKLATNESYEKQSNAMRLDLLRNRFQALLAILKEFKATTGIVLFVIVGHSALYIAILSFILSTVPWIFQALGAFIYICLNIGRLIILTNCGESLEAQV
jgi:hypothetical protein